MDEKRHIEITERLTKLEASSKSAHHRLDEVQDIVNAIRDMAYEVKHMREDLNSVAQRMDEFEKKPIRRYNMVITTIVTALSSGLITFILSNVLPRLLTS